MRFERKSPQLQLTQAHCRHTTAAEPQPLGLSADRADLVTRAPADQRDATILFRLLADFSGWVIPDARICSAIVGCV